MSGSERSATRACCLLIVAVLRRPAGFDLVAQDQAVAGPANLGTRASDQAFERVDLELDDVVVLLERLPRQPHLDELGAAFTDGIFAGLPLLQTPLELGDVGAELFADGI